MDDTINNKKTIKRNKQIFKKKTTPLTPTIKPLITSGLCFFGFKPTSSPSSPSPSL